MRKTINLNVRVGGELGQFVDARTGEHGDYENSSEYVRALIRQDKERAEQQAFERLKAELQRDFAAPEDSYREVSADDVINRNASRS